MILFATIMHSVPEFYNVLYQQKTIGKAETPTQAQDRTVPRTHAPLDRPVPFLTKKQDRPSPCPSTGGNDRPPVACCKACLFVSHAKFNS